MLTVCQTIPGFLDSRLFYILEIPLLSSVQGGSQAFFPLWNASAASHPPSQEEPAVSRSSSLPAGSAAVVDAVAIAGPQTFLPAPASEAAGLRAILLAVLHAVSLAELRAVHVAPGTGAAGPQVSADIALLSDVSIPVSYAAGGVDSHGHPRFPVFPSSGYHATSSSHVEASCW